MAVERPSEGPTYGQPRAVKRKPSISVVGAGRLGTALARALALSGYKIEAVVARTARHARKAADVVGTRPLALDSTQLDQLPSSDIIFITTPDDQIVESAAQLAALVDGSGRKMKGDHGRSNRGRTALHASGALSSAVLQRMGDVGFATGSMHPLVSVSDPVQGAENLRAAFFCVEGTPAAVRTMRPLLRSLAAQSFSITADKKALYHAAAVIASGHTTALFDVVVEMLTRCGLTPRRARAVILPLLRTTLENLYTNDPAKALTGTFARADVATVEKHLAALRSPEMRDALAVYVLLGKRSLCLAEAAGARPSSINKIARLLAKSVSTNNE